MKICVVGKYPPIEGGVSAQTYWLCRGLAQRGHQIHVVTNADEVEERYRIQLLPDDNPFLQPEFSESGGFVKVHNATQYDTSVMGHIPAGNPFVTKLASLATDVIRAQGCSMVLGYYFEPYAMAAALASVWTGMPLVIKHAGSDLDRLFAVPDLSAAYREMLKMADIVVTQPHLVNRFVGTGVSRTRIRTGLTFSPDPTFFHPHAISALPGTRFELENTTPGVPSIGIYGKIGVAKGTFDLISALRNLADDGYRFNFLALVGAEQGARLMEEIGNGALAERTTVIPLMPNWRVPSFLKKCDAICFLERDFPVQIHGPIVPTEVLSCGRCLVLSSEIFDKLKYKEDLVDMRNLVVIDDPKDIQGLTRKLGSVLSDIDRVRSIGAEAAKLFPVETQVQDWNDFIGGWERLIKNCISNHRLAGSEAREEPTSQQDAGSLLPELPSFVEENISGAYHAVSWRQEDRWDYDKALQYCEALLAFVKDSEPTQWKSQFCDALRYAHARLLVGHHMTVPKTTSQFPAICRIGNRKLSDHSLTLFPIVARDIVFRSFEYNVSKIFLINPGRPQPPKQILQDLLELPVEDLRVAFVRTPNLAPVELRIDDATYRLMRLCDGTRTVKAVTDMMAQYFCRTESDAQVSLKVEDALMRLKKDKCLVFAEWRNGYGWEGGDR